MVFHTVSRARAKINKARAKINRARAKENRARTKINRARANINRASFRFLIDFDMAKNVGWVALLGWRPLRRPSNQRHPPHPQPKELSGVWNPITFGNLKRF